MSKMTKNALAWDSAAARRIVELAGAGGTVEDSVSTIAQRLLDGVAGPPTCLEALARKLHVHSITADEQLPFSGELRKEVDGFKIVYSSSLSAGRRRFTIAHELGHAVFESTGSNCPRFGRELERICDMLASEFIFPRSAFLAEAGATPDPAKVLDLSRRFEASLMATALRCHKLSGVSVFQVEQGKVSWGYGAVRDKSGLRDDILRQSIHNAMAGECGEAVVYLGNGVRLRKWLARWKSLRSERALFVLQPAAPLAKDQRGTTLLVRFPA